MIRLSFHTGERAGSVLTTAINVLRIGSAPRDNDLVLGDPEVAPQHAIVQQLPTGSYVCHDLNAGPTLVNGAPAAPGTVLHLRVGDVLRLGTTDIELGDGRARLMVLSGPQVGRNMPIGDEPVTMGYSRDNALPLDDAHVSAYHARLWASPVGFVLEDTQSTNGTWVNGQRVTQCLLGDGDAIRIGTSDLRFMIEVGDAPAARRSLQMLAVEPAEVAAPRFVIDAEVEDTDEISIGQSPTCTLRLDDVAAVHCTIRWDDGFVLEDRSRRGTYVNDQRVARARLQTGHVLQIGRHLINVAVRGDQCYLERVDTAKALATIEAARQTSIKLEEAEPQPATGWAPSDQTYRTVVDHAAPDPTALLREKQAAFKRMAPAWRPSSDIRADWVPRYTLIGSVVAAAAACVGLYVFEGDSALANHPLSDAHASVEFAAQVEQAGLAAGCASCHSAAAGVSDDKCAACHEGFRERIRGPHRDPASDAHRVTPGQQCAACHREHRGDPRVTAAGRPVVLGAGDGCSGAQCHPNQHSREFLREGLAPPRAVDAGPVPSFELSQRELHVAHAVVDHDGAPLAIGCTSCHASAAEGGDQLVEAAPGKACFGCHSGGEEYVNAQCLSCHRDEHEGIALARLADGDPRLARAAPPPTAKRSLVTGGVFALVALIPVIGIGLVNRARRRTRSERMIAALREFPVESIKRLVHSINRDKCVGCNMCIKACPTSVLELVNHKSVVVNFDACIQCGKCEEACAFDALKMHEADQPPPTVSMPAVDANYMTPVAGMYLIGQAAGTPQVKNASNLGLAVVQHMRAHGLAPGAGRALGCDTDVVIVGSGPAGLSAAISCARAGVGYVVLEKRREFAWTIRSFYHKGKPVMAEPHDVDLVGPLPHWDTTREDLLAAWAQAIADHDVAIRYDHGVTNVSKQGEVFRVSVADLDGEPLGDITCVRVVLAIGTLGNPRRLGCPGDRLDKVHSSLVDPDDHSDRNILVVGGSDSAVEVALALCDQNRVWLSCRGAGFERLKPTNHDLIQAAFDAGRVTPLLATTVVEVTETSVVVEHRTQARRETLPNDVVIAMIGGEPPVAWLQSIGVPYVPRPHSWSPPRTDELARRYDTPA